MFHKTKRTLHLFFVTASFVLVVAAIWHFYVSPLRFSGGLIGRLGGVGCLLIAGIQFFEGGRDLRKVVKGTKIVSPKRFQSLVGGDGLGIPYIDKTFLGKGNGSLMMRIKKKHHPQHIIILGDTGTGKSALKHHFLHQIRSDSNDGAIIYDPSGEFWKYHGISTRDTLLYPFATESPFWNITEEIRGQSDAQALAKSFIPDKYDGKSDFWQVAPRKLLAFLLMELKRQNLTTKELVKWISDGELLNEMVAGTALESLIDPRASAQRAGVLASLSLVCDSLEMLPPNDGRKSFSFREWAKKREGFVFIPTRTRERVALKPVISALLDTAFNSLMEEVDSSRRNVWVFCDELFSLQRLPSLEMALYESRKYGVCFCLGFQGRSQVQSLYGKSSEAILSASATKIILRTSEFKAAEWASLAIGKPEMKKKSETINSALWGRTRDSISTKEDLATNYLVIPNEIQIMPNFTGYLVNSGYAVNFTFEYPKLESS